MVKKYVHNLLAIVMFVYTAAPINEICWVRITTKTTTTATSKAATTREKKKKPSKHKIYSGSSCVVSLCTWMYAKLMNGVGGTFCDRVLCYCLFGL